jgi:hypothetical protein
MKSVNRSFALGAVLTATVTLCAGNAVAAAPTTVVGTWSLLTNQSFGQLIVTNQGVLGICKVILGSVNGADMNGWYCPATGRIHFYHKNAVTHLPIKIYDGYVADRISGSPDRIGGTYVSDYAPIQPYGEYPFSAMK